MHDCEHEAHGGWHVFVPAGFPVAEVVREGHPGGAHANGYVEELVAGGVVEAGEGEFEDFFAEAEGHVA
jgi:hypothetical protein